MSKKTAVKPKHPTEAQMQADDDAFEHGDGKLVGASEAQEDEEETDYVVQTHDAILPEDAKRGKDTVKAGMLCQVGDIVTLLPSVAKAHQDAGVGLSLLG